MGVWACGNLSERLHCIEKIPCEGYAVHELSIAQSLMEIVLEEGRRHRLGRVKLIRLQVGELAAVVPESLEFCFEMVSKDTIAEGAVLDIESVPVVANCSQCRMAFEVENHVFLCPQCGEPTFELVSGRELSVVSIEGETGEGDGSD
jgi:hydrogenase nickel incorporation protein HypA/HybF